MKAPYPIQLTDLGFQKIMQNQGEWGFRMKMVMPPLILFYMYHRKNKEKINWYQMEIE